MSITIRHLDGPLKGDPDNCEKIFGDETNSILIGRATGAQVVYPEECIAVDGEHLRLNREADGGYTIELCGSCDVEIDGEPAETGAKVASGSIIRVGVEGPSFEVVLPGISIRHGEGPLAGQRQYFSDSMKSITFGRPPEKTDVAYPEDYTKVGRFHFTLKRMDSGNYVVELTPGHYVEINKEPAKNQSTVKSGSKFRLGDAKGPSFDVLIEQPAKKGAVTEENYEPPSEFSLIKQLQRVAAVLFVMLLAGGALFFYRDWQHGKEVNRLAADIAKTDDQLTELAKHAIPQSAQNALQQAVYLVAEVGRKNDDGKATAWAFGPNMLATNAHVTKEIEGQVANWVLIGPNGERIKIAKVETHPGYAKFKDYLRTVGGTPGGKFEPLDVVNEYDVGIIYTVDPLPAAPGTREIVTLEPAPKDYVAKIEPGAAVAAIGFPIEEMTARMVVTHAPATLHFGNISSLTDVFMCRADKPDHRLLIQHTVPVTGGMSGSPLIDASGKVIGIVSGGNTDGVVKEVKVTKDRTSGAPSDDKNRNRIEIENMRVPSAALVNFAQRIDSLEELRDGEVELTDDQEYWEGVAKNFTSFFDTAKADLVASVEDIYKVTASPQIRSGTLKPNKAGAASYDSASYSWTLEPGHVYGFIADSKSGIPIALNVKRQNASKAKPEFLKSENTDPQAPVSPLAPAIWVTVDETTPVNINLLALIKNPANYDLYIYDWVKPTEAPPADASSATSQK